MCQRKIIGKGIFKIVPVMNGCDCPQITQIRDVDSDPIRADEILAEAPQTPIVPVTHTCRDIKTDFKMKAYPVTFRFCECDDPNGCKNLPRTDLADNKFLGAPEEEFWTENGKGVYFEGL
jgi:hypothetical protein